MSEEQTLSFVAIITLSLPDSEETISANVTLLPQDMISVDGRYKRLQDCTLADLQAYADLLEKEVWETYEEITLIELAQDEQITLELTIYDAGGDPIAPDNEWLDSVVVTLGGKEETAVTEDEPTVVEAIEDAETPAEMEDTAVKTEEPEIAPEPEPVAAEEEPEIVVAESQPVHEEPEADGATIDTPTIAPSRARVRIAGKRRPIGDETWSAVDILIEEPALRAAQVHALSSMNREVAGVLVGPSPEKQPDGRYVVHIHDTIIAKHTVMHGASVTYTPESWRYMNDVLRERYPDDTAVMVGWYHTHPGFGIFLSGMDLFIHQNFFTQIWHVALVLDPRARKSGFFGWNRHKSEVRPYDFPWPSWADGSW